MPSNDRKRLTPARLQVLEKEKRALELRTAGLSYGQIAEQLGWNSPSSARKAIKRLLDEQILEPSQELRKMEVLRLDQMLTALWPAAMSGKWLAHDRILRVMERKAALLGLDAPQRRIVDVITHDAFADAMKELEQQVKELEEGAQPELEREVDYTVPEEDITDAEVVERATIER